MHRKFPFNIEDIESLSAKDRIQIDQKDSVYTLGLGITSRCNLRCPKCYYRGYTKNSNRDLPLPLIKAILKNCSKLRMINLALEGEPFCYPYILDVLEHANTYSNAISISSNGTSLHSALIKDLSNFKFNIFSLSIDADNKNKYELFQKGSSWDKFIRNTSLLCDLLGDKVGFTTVLYSQNLKHIHELPELARKIGVSYINLMQLRGHEFAISQGVTEPEESELISSLDIFIENATKHEVPIYIDRYFGNKRIMDKLRSVQSRFLILSNDESKMECSYPWFYTSILSDGSLFPCCGDFQPVKVDNFSFDNIYNHRYLQILRSAIIHGKIPMACKKCHYNA